ncbi:TRAP transporter substrate-binding protein [Virgisporangium ochraceum]|uniref:C4-dicarboxylate ABC transporter n=1 Tax=Virgisporangium ochraceum TaxID=65505 RepID=A0A8J4A681_9ACTN|nr:TRAP transporter substrate-binding protein [Virgisporangium ochraceum]GIJ73581.1 C4-dicarboxylate ABC transporter [Virgisporangium ochraceum]
MNRRRFLSLSLATTGLAAGAGALTGCGDDEVGSGDRVEVRLGDTVNETNPQIAAERFFGERLAALTDDAYEVKVFPNGQLGDHNKMNEQVHNGSLPMTKTLFANLTAFDKRLGVMSLPYSFAKQEDLFVALVGGLGQQLGRILEYYDLKVLAFFDSGARNVYNKKRPIRTPADLKGLKIRVPQDAVAIETFNTLGATATPMATGEIYGALQKGTIDAAENNPIFYVTNKHVEEAKFWSWTRHQFGVDALLVSKKWFDGRPKPHQDAFVEAGWETQQRERELWAAETEKYIKQAADSGAQINDDIDFAAFQQAVRPVVDKYRGTFGDLLDLLPLG